LQGYIQKLLAMDCQVFIPFVCKHCGECCRKVGVDLAHINPFEVAKHLGMSAKEVVKTYLGEITFYDGEKIEIKITKSRLPCPFLKENECLIHPVKPDVCKGFPVTTDFGDHGIGCLGEEEASRTIHALGKGVPYFASPIETTEEIYVPDEKWEKIIKKYLKSNPSKEALELFLEFNRPLSYKTTEGEDK
jgi:Fe-S-cluster containining protein